MNPLADLFNRLSSRKQTTTPLGLQKQKELLMHNHLKLREEMAISHAQQQMEAQIEAFRRKQNSLK